MRYIINTVNGASIGINECLDHTLDRLFKRRLTSVYKNRALSHFQFAQRFYLNTICRKQFHQSICCTLEKQLSS